MDDESDDKDDTKRWVINIYYKKSYTYIYMHSCELHHKTAVGGPHCNWQLWFKDVDKTETTTTEGKTQQSETNKWA